MPDLKVGQLEHTVSGRHDEVRHDVNCLGQKPDLVLPRQQAERETALAARRISRCRNLQLTAIPVPPFLTDRGYLIQVLNCRVDTVNVVCERLVRAIPGCLDHAGVHFANGLESDLQRLVGIVEPDNAKRLERKVGRRKVQLVVRVLGRNAELEEEVPFGVGSYPGAILGVQLRHAPVPRGGPTLENRLSLGQVGCDRVGISKSKGSPPNCGGGSNGGPSELRRGS